MVWVDLGVHNSGAINWLVRVPRLNYGKKPIHYVEKGGKIHHEYKGGNSNGRGHKQQSTIS